MRNFTEEEQLVFDVFTEKETFSKERLLTEINIGNYVVYYNCRNMEDVAKAYVKDLGILRRVECGYRKFFDYKALGKDLEENMFDGFFCKDSYGVDTFVGIYQ